jgi:hypothetical protein
VKQFLFLPRALGGMGFASLSRNAPAIFFTSLIESARIDTTLKNLLLAGEDSASAPFAALTAALQLINQGLPPPPEDQGDHSRDFILRDLQGFGDIALDSQSVAIPSTGSSAARILECLDSRPPPAPGRKTRLQAKILRVINLNARDQLVTSVKTLSPQDRLALLPALTLSHRSKATLVDWTAPNSRKWHPKPVIFITTLLTHLALPQIPKSRDLVFSEELGTCIEHARPATSPSTSSPTTRRGRARPPSRSATRGTKNRWTSSHATPPRRD